MLHLSHTPHTLMLRTTSARGTKTALGGGTATLPSSSPASTFLATTIPVGGQDTGGWAVHWWVGSTLVGGRYTGGGGSTLGGCADRQGSTLSGCAPQTRITPLAPFPISPYGLHLISDYSLVRQ